MPANPLSSVAEIKTDGSVKYALQATYIQDYATSGHFLNRFLANAGVGGVISIGNTSNKSSISSTYTDINSLLNASDVEKHLFTFETQSDGNIKVKNCNDTHIGDLIAVKDLILLVVWVLLLLSPLRLMVVTRACLYCLWTILL